MCYAGLGKVKNLHKINSVEVYFSSFGDYYTVEFSYNKIEYNLVEQIFKYYIADVEDYELLDSGNNKLLMCDIKNAEYFLVKSNSYLLYDYIYYIPFIKNNFNTLENSKKVNIYSGTR